MADDTERSDPETRALLEDALAASEMSLRSFAENHMVRDERTVRRWRAGAPIPAVAQAKLRVIVREAKKPR